MRIALALAAVLIASPAWAGVDPMPTVDSANLSTDNPLRQPEALFKVQNRSDAAIENVIVSCAAVDGESPVDVQTNILKNLKPHEAAFGMIAFLNRVPSGSHVTCRIEDAF